ncbi:Ceramide glucosyltransferase [Saitoella coloradoensis]
MDSPIRDDDVALGMLHWYAAALCLVWYIIMMSLGLFGVYVVKTTYGSTYHSLSASSPDSPGVSILRPLKGLDVEMKACLESAFLQDYPRDKFEVILSVADATDPAVNVAKDVIERHPEVNARLSIGGEDAGPNPKINNLIRSYESAKYDILWVLDSNVWVSPGTLARSVDAFASSPRIQLVHHLPVCVSSDAPEDSTWGARLEENYMSCAHAKMYSAINKVAVAPCVMGKSNLFRRSDLNRVAPGGLTDFAQFIAEDHLIADALWTKGGGRTVLTGDCARQPVQGTSATTYFLRRVRWIRVRKFMVTAATLMEPITESLLCAAMGAFALRSFYDIPFLFTYIATLAVWCASDYVQFRTLHSCGNVEYSPYTPAFARGNLNMGPGWFITWIVRELTAFPVWITAMAGQGVTWRDRLFRIKVDMTVEEIRPLNAREWRA